ncbi:MAG: sigma 54-interacting transcriptional regulator [Anaerovoracaceae bacterium]
MNRSLLYAIISNIGAPAFIVSEEGMVLFKNSDMRLVREIMKTGEINHLNEMNIKEEATVRKNVFAFKINNSSLTGFVYEIEAGELLKLYIFDKSIATDRTVANVVEHIDEVVVIFNKDGVIERMNKICDEILPFKRCDIIGKNVMELVDEGLVTGEPIIMKLINTKEKCYHNITYPNGKIISYTGIPIFGSRGNFRGGVLTGRDVSRIIDLAKKNKKSIIKDENTEYISVNSEIENIKNMITKVAPSDAPIFIIGESGVGKEILTRSVWKQSNRRDKPFLAINCGAIPSNLIESELFGYEKGSFTGANNEGKKGLIEAANGGTMFLDEIGEMPLETQKKFLRVLQEGKIMRIGGLDSKEVDVRFVCATNKTIKQLQDPEVFRQDLFYRLSVIPIVVPPLRERKEDIIPIVNYYLEKFNYKYGRNIYLTEEAKNLMVEKNWPGNIRELKNVVERLAILSPYDKIYKTQVERSIIGTNLSNPMRGGTSEEAVRTIGKKKIEISEIMDLNEAYQAVEQEIISKAVEKYGSVTAAAKAIGINPSTIYRKIKKGEIIL